MAAVDLGNPILNSPYEPPEAHFEIGPSGPTGNVLPGRRPSESFIPVPTQKKGKKAGDQAALDFDVTGERREANPLINDIRREVDLWRARQYPGVTAYSRKLLQYWANREEPVLFCQREAAETAIFLAEVAGRHGGADYRTRLDPVNKEYNDGLPRVGLKMATGSGKTVVMAMLIAWQTINKVATPNDARFAKRFLVVTPGITIRDRLRVLEPADPNNYYRERDLVPVDLWDALLQAQVTITNYHAFLLRDAKEIEGVAANTRKLLTAGKKVDPFKETPDAMVTRVLRDLSGKGEIVVFNDEAHHCYRNAPDPEAAVDTEAKQRNEDARVWFRGLQAVKKKVGIKTIFDLSATPFFLRGTGHPEGFIFPWVVSDFSLMDAIESGIVKVPRVPVNDDSKAAVVTNLHLWDYVGSKLPKRKSKTVDVEGGWYPPAELQTALEGLHESYELQFRAWEEELAALGEPPPVMIVVCPNTVVSKLVFDWIAGQEIEHADGTVALRTGALRLLSNVEDGQWVHRQRTVLIDSAQLESGEALKADFKQAAAHEIDAFKTEYRLRNPGADVDKLTDEDLLREVMNTVGKKGKLGEHVRCVVSVSMLTEGWDANTVTHILGIRAFRSQLLCEQVVGRGLRRRSYAVNDQGRFEPEYAEVYGVPFAFIPSDRPVVKPPPSRPAILVEALDDRFELAIRFPKLDGYRVEIPDEQLEAKFTDESLLRVDRDVVALWTETAGIVGTTAEQNLDKYRHVRAQEVAYKVAARVVQRFCSPLDAVQRPWLFPTVVDITRRWLDGCVTFTDDATVGLLLLAEGQTKAAEAVYNSIVRVEGEREEVLQPLLRRFDPEGSTHDVRFATRKAVVEATKSHVNYVVLDGPKGTNTWEEAMAGLLEAHPKVAAFVKNDHLGFTIPYVHEGRSHDYVPDFLVRLAEPGDGIERSLIIEVSGGGKKAHGPGPTAAKADTACHHWCPAVNNDGRWGRWAFVETHSKEKAGDDLNAAIDALFADTPALV